MSAWEIYNKIEGLGFCSGKPDKYVSNNVMTGRKIDNEEVGYIFWLKYKRNN